MLAAPSYSLSVSDYYLFNQTPVATFERHYFSMDDTDGSALTETIDSILADLPPDHRDRVREQLAELRSVQPGWSDGEGISISAAAISSAKEYALAISQYFDGVDIYPSEDGGVELQCYIGNNGLFISISQGGAVSGARFSTPERPYLAPYTILGPQGIIDWLKESDLV